MRPAVVKRRDVEGCMAPSMMSRPDKLTRGPGGRAGAWGVGCPMATYG
jgi:hypothetical protein